MEHNMNNALAQQNAESISIAQIMQKLKYS